MSAAPAIARARIVLALVVLALAALRAPAQRGERSDRIVEGDLVYWLFDGYLDFAAGDVRVRAGRGVLVLDADEEELLLQRVVAGDELPHRGPIAPFAQERAIAARLRDRLVERARALAAAGDRPPLEIPPGKEQLARLVRAIYAEGGVNYQHADFRHVRCERLYLSFASDRAVIEDAEVRMPAGASLAPRDAPLVMRAARIVQQGSRLVAYDARVTTCDAGEPHFELASQRLLVTQHRAVTEFHGQGNTLRVDGLPALPLPDYRYYSDQENWLPLKDISAGVSDERGEFVLARFGGRFNDVGQAIVDMFGGSAELFRGEWWLRSGWMRKRGTPLEGGLEFELPGVFRGDLEGFFLEDRGQDRRSVTTELNGTPITERTRRFATGRFRAPLDTHTRVDAQVFWSGDPAAYPEFRPFALKEHEQPETSVEVRRAQDNWRLGLLGRWNLVDFAYSDRADLQPRFLSERPYFEADLFSQPLLEVAEDWPLVLDASAGGGRLRHQIDDHAPAWMREAAWRVDTSLELGAPHTFGPIAFTPYAGARETWYSDRPNATDDAFRKVLEVGAVAGTRLGRAFDANSEALAIRGLYHELRPEVRTYHRFEVDRSPADYFQFDEVDALTERSVVDLTLLQRLQTRRKNARGESVASDLVWLDVTQRLFPDATRDNAGETVGPTFFELIVTPGSPWLPVPNLKLLFEGEYDFAQSDFRTRNVGVLAGPDGGPTVGAEWRSGSDGDGTGSLYATTHLFQRWTLYGGLIWNFDQHDLASTSVAIIRQDHDWTFLLGVSRDANTGDESVTLRFTPTLGGLVRPARPRYAGGDPVFGVRSY